MTELSDYLDLIEPRRPGFAPTPQTVHRPTKYTTPGFAASAPTSSARATTLAPSSRYVAPRALPPGVGVPFRPSADPAADRARADCISFCSNPANARECIPAAAGGSGACSWAIPAAPGGGALPLPSDWRPPAFDPGGGTVAPSPEPDTTAAAKPLWPWLVAAVVAWKILRR